MARYEEERYGGQRASTRRGGGGYNERARDDDFEQEERDRYRSSEFGRDYGETERYGGASGARNEGSWRSRERDYGRSLGSRGYEGYDEQENFGSPYNAGDRDINRSGGQYGNQGRTGGQRYGQGMRDYNPSQGFGFSPEPDEMRWSRQQGLHGSSEYGGHISSQRSQADYQSHAGKGPKGWQRSDERIREEVNEALARHPDIDPTEIEVRVQSGEVTLTGTVDERRDKRMAEDIVEQVLGVKDVENKLKVKGGLFGLRGDRDVTNRTEREAENQETIRRKTAGSTSGITAGPTPR